MYGTIMRVKIKPGGIEQIRNRIETHRPPGMVWSYVYQMDDEPKEILMTVGFKDKKAYWDYAESSESDSEYRKMAKFFDGEPEWNDGEIVVSLD
jgi:hypothetical protein